MPSKKGVEMKRIVLSVLVLFCLGNVSYGQRANCGCQQQQMAMGSIPELTEAWNSPEGRAARRIAGAAAKRGLEIEGDRIQQAWQERQNERQRYDAALR